MSSQNSNEFSSLIDPESVKKSQSFSRLEPLINASNSADNLNPFDFYQFAFSGHHDNQLPDQQIMPLVSLKPYECKICSTHYLTNGELIRHKRYKHDGGKPHKCDQCPYECVEMAKLIRHKRMHAGVKPFKCPSCQYQSYDKSKIKRHYITHTREKPFQCGLCGSRFTQSGSLKTHLTNVHEMTKLEFCCPFCNLMVTSNMGELRNHIRFKHRSNSIQVVTNKENQFSHIQQEECSTSYDNQITYL